MCFCIAFFVQLGHVFFLWSCVVFLFSLNVRGLAVLVFIPQGAFGATVRRTLICPERLWGFPGDRPALEMLWHEVPSPFWVIFLVFLHSTVCLARFCRFLIVLCCVLVFLIGGLAVPVLFFGGAFCPTVR